MEMIDEMLWMDKKKNKEKKIQWQCKQETRKDGKVELLWRVKTL